MDSIIYYLSTGIQLRGNSSLQRGCYFTTELQSQVRGKNGSFVCSDTTQSEISVINFPAIGELSLYNQFMNLLLHEKKKHA
ncbi:hypothetical protein PROFUN_14440 [Planoprotostelium fungivorum]|uniref:Uncharacterized protein n=1 Tax=Planoprotostelium fungivorum TaxID=1890364 RepID=A0A2P6N0B2_9EUKA|nr:hypothetical protein PROFUN_14440 [Planoprotostelium fungivorum]